MIRATFMAFALLWQNPVTVAPNTTVAAKTTLTASVVVPSNVALVHSAVGTNGSSGTYTITLPATTSGNFVHCWEADYASAPGAPSVPTDSNGDTFISDGSFPNVGRITTFSLANVGAGRTVITLHPASGASSGVCSEWSGVATASPFIGCGPSNLSNGAVTIWSGSSVQSTVNALALGSVYNRVGVADTYSPLDNWTTLQSSPDSGDGDQLYTEYIANGLPSWFTAVGGITTGRTEFSQTCLYKSAVAGTSSGNQPPLYTRFDDGGTNGTTTTDALTTNATHGQAVVSTGTASPNTGAVYSNTQAISPATPVFANGVKYTASSISMSYDLGQNGANARTVKWTPVPATNASFSWGCHLYFPEVSDAVNPFTIIGVVTGGGADRAEFAIQNDNWTLEAVSGDSTPQSLTGHLNQWIWVTGLYNGTGSGNHKMRVYTCSSGCGTQSNWTLLGTEATQAVTGTNAAVSFAIGRLGAESGGTGFTEYFSGCQVDPVNATYPLLP